jgi:hypothetical protein
VKKVHVTHTYYLPEFSTPKTRGDHRRGGVI